MAFASQVPTWALPVARPIIHETALVGAQARRLAGSLLLHASAPPPVYIVGCGRSGTSLLGKLLRLHPAVEYLFEPLARWAAVDRRTDYMRVHFRTPGFAVLDPAFVTPTLQRRFRDTFQPLTSHILIEKSPINVMRIGYLDALSPGARYIHVIRDGHDVARSIASRAKKTVPYPPGRTLNRWWGLNDIKWKALAREAGPYGHSQSEVAQLTTDTQRGAFEWIMSHSELARWRDHVGERLCEIKYADILSDPTQALERLARHISLQSTISWTRQAITAVESRNLLPAPAPPLILPPTIAHVFNTIQESFGLTSRATAAT